MAELTVIDDRELRDMSEKFVDDSNNLVDDGTNVRLDTSEIYASKSRVRARLLIHIARKCNDDNQQTI